MQATAAPHTCSAPDPAPYGPPIISPDTTMVSSSNCLPIVEYTAGFADTRQPTGIICEVDQNVAIVERESPAGTVFIPIQQCLSSSCAKFYHRNASDGNEYLLGEIYLAMMSQPGFVGIKQWIAPLVSRLQAQLMDGTFARSEQGKFTQLVTYLQKPIKILRQGPVIIPPDRLDGLEDGIFEHLSPYHFEGRGYKGYYSMYVSLPTFGGAVLSMTGTPEYLLHMFILGSMEIV